jgi:hypothetical protein
MLLPDDALDFVRQDRGVAEVLRDTQPSVAQLPRSWIMASEVHLSGPDERDIIVIATGPLSGANVTTFWVLRQSGQGLEIMLTAQAHDLFIRSTRSKGHRDVETFAATAVRVSTVCFLQVRRQSIQGVRTSFKGHSVRLLAAPDSAIAYRHA